MPAILLLAPPSFWTMRRLWPHIIIILNPIKNLSFLLYFFSIGFLQILFKKLSPRDLTMAQQKTTNQRGNQEPLISNLQETYKKAVLISQVSKSNYRTRAFITRAYENWIKIKRQVFLNFQVPAPMKIEERSSVFFF